MGGRGHEIDEMLGNRMLDTSAPGAYPGFSNGGGDFFLETLSMWWKGGQGGLPPWSSKIFESIDPNRANLKLSRNWKK